MRLTVINQFYPPDVSPTAHLCSSLADHRAALGDRVTMITSRSGYLGRLDVGERATLVNVHRVWSTRLGSRSRVRRSIDWGTFYLSAVIHTAMLPRQDVIISLTTPPYIALAALLHKSLHPRTRIVLWNMDSYPEAVERTGMIKAGGPLSRVMRALNRFIFRRIDHLVCLDEAMAELLSQYKPQNRELPTTIVPNWEKAELFPSLAMQQHTTRTANDPFAVLYLGNAGYGHEFETVVAAAEMMREERVMFLFVGGGARQAWIAEQARRLNLNNIQFRDYVAKERTPALMLEADCGLITLEEQMAGVMSPSKLHANLAMGLPILYVGPPRTNVDAAIARFACGIRLRPGQAAKMAAFIRELMTDPKRLSEMRAAARQAFEAAYCDAKTLPQFDAILGGFSALSP